MQIAMSIVSKPYWAREGVFVTSIALGRIIHSYLRVAVSLSLSNSIHKLQPKRFCWWYLWRDDRSVEIRRTWNHQSTDNDARQRADNVVSIFSQPQSVTCHKCIVTHNMYMSMYIQCKHSVTVNSLHWQMETKSGMAGCIYQRLWIVANRWTLNDMTTPHYSATTNNGVNDIDACIA